MIGPYKRCIACNGARYVNHAPGEVAMQLMLKPCPKCMTESRGRPRMLNGQRRDDFIKCRMTLAERVSLIRAASAAKMSVSEFVRYAIRQAS